MPVAAFDTLKYARTLRDAGLPGEQAEAQAIALGDVLSNTMQTSLEDVAKKTDIHQLEAKFDAKLERLYGEMLLHKWMGSAIFTAIVAMVIKVFFYPTL